MCTSHGTDLRMLHCLLTTLCCISWQAKNIQIHKYSSSYHQVLVFILLVGFSQCWAIVEKYQISRYYRFWHLNSSFWQLTLSRWQMNSSCWQMNSSRWLLNSSLWLLNSSLWHENSSVTRLAAGVNTKTRCSSCVIILFKYNCCKQLLRRR